MMHRSLVCKAVSGISYTELVLVLLVSVVLGDGVHVATINNTPNGTNADVGSVAEALATSTSSQGQHRGSSPHHHQHHQHAHHKHHHYSQQSAHESQYPYNPNHNASVATKALEPSADSILDGRADEGATANPSHSNNVYGDERPPKESSIRNNLRNQFYHRHRSHGTSLTMSSTRQPLEFDDSTKRIMPVSSAHAKAPHADKWRSASWTSNDNGIYTLQMGQRQPLQTMHSTLKRRHAKRHRNSRWHRHDAYYANIDAVAIDGDGNGEGINSDSLAVTSVHDSDNIDEHGPAVGELIADVEVNHREAVIAAELQKANEKQKDLVWPSKKEAIMEGDLILGGLMMVHSRDDLQMCGPIMPQGGIQALEAMLYTLDRINSDKKLLPNVTIGAHILDDCDRDSYGLEMAVDFIKGKNLPVIYVSVKRILCRWNLSTTLFATVQTVVTSSLFLNQETKFEEKNKQFRLHKSILTSSRRDWKRIFSEQLYISIRA